MFDTSTLNQAALAKLRPYIPPPTYRVDRHLGAGCAGDPPGFPTYYLRSVYTQHGNSPAKGPGYVIQDDAGILRRFPEHGWQGTRDEAASRWDALLRAFWLPLPYAHPRVRAWIVSTYQHHRHCYRDLDGIEPPEYGRPALLIYPVPSYKLRHFTDDPRFSDEWRTKERAAVDQANAELRAKYDRACCPETHSAFLIVREYYPEHTPDLTLIADPSREARLGNWWETEDQPPTPETCTAGAVAGRKLYRGVSGPPNGGRHPLNGTWCQWCGWQAST